MKRLLIVFTLSLILIAKPLLAQSYDTEVISAELYRDTIERTGKLDYKRTLSLSFKTSGYLTLLSIDEGEQFKKGQLLASLDITELTEQKNSNYAQMTQAKREVKRISGLMDNQLASERDMDAAITRVEITQAAYQVAYYNLVKAKIYAPFSGVVLARDTELGEFQSPGHQALKVAKLDWVVKVALTGQEISQVRLGQKASVALSQTGIVEGIISKIPAMANESSHLFIIEVLLPKIKITSGMIAGQLAKVSIAFESDKFVYQLPIAALVAVDDEDKAIFIVQSSDNSVFKEQSFQVFQIDNDYVYLKAVRNSQPLKIVTKGWQNIVVAGN
ncbi:efflux RND transporter periplasmic adaptor subunit [Colwellia sp. MB02u-9]|uniref:efflux RND transporter periplasmic adaptor subunit n=1 Tax=Colwellia sp. MB02u-9 TaxID=2759823 RepID=UPI0015F46B28|nr:efflux RND transporter periplasmic adaptor subunit [Colwellia sp. MB02u-9]MBA6295126.1 efflux RND transporter periplasmic adaptor subunit [Colwellia sp. MB02u-9]